MRPSAKWLPLPENGVSVATGFNRSVREPRGLIFGLFADVDYAGDAPPDVIFRNERAPVCDFDIIR